MFPAKRQERAAFAKAGYILRSEGDSALLPASARYQTVTTGGMIIMLLVIVLGVFFFLRRGKLYNKSLYD